MPVLPEKSAVTIAQGATLKVEGMHVVSNAVSGAGDIVLASGARFGAADLSGFSGKISGAGEFVVVGGLEGVEADVDTVSFADGAIVLKEGNLETAAVKTKTAHVILPETGTIRGDGVTIFGKAFKIAECSSWSGPKDTTGWTIEKGKPGIVGKFYYADGALWCHVNGGGLVIILR